MMFTLDFTIPFNSSLYRILGSFSIAHPMKRQARAQIAPEFSFATVS
ncbi:hypothetical protein SORDD24_00994 [Streptococcus oralis]|uniref:Uncharacterized protein n=1 Tax=Streptococcus oralis TaxID=1303 RepID=A0A139QRM5_STROR|nr:hypothetical protein SORDD24_00994 [Streptococcus oralis]